MNIREYLRVVVHEDHQKATASTLLFVGGKKLSGAAGAALLLMLEQGPRE